MTKERRKQQSSHQPASLSYPSCTCMRVNAFLLHTIILCSSLHVMQKHNALQDIRESVDSIYRNTPIYQMKRLRTPEGYSYKPFQTQTTSTSASVPYKTLKDIMKVPHPRFGSSSSSSSVRMTYLKIGESICRGSFTSHLHLGVCMIIDAQNRLSWSNTTTLLTTLYMYILAALQ